MLRLVTMLTLILVGGTLVGGTVLAQDWEKDCQGPDISREPTVNLWTDGQLLTIDLESEECFPDPDFAILIASNGKIGNIRIKMVRAQAHYQFTGQQRVDLFGKVNIGGKVQYKIEITDTTELVFHINYGRGIPKIFLNRQLIKTLYFALSFGEIPPKSFPQFRSCQKIWIGWTKGLVCYPKTATEGVIDCPLRSVKLPSSGETIFMTTFVAIALYLIVAATLRN